METHEEPEGPDTNAFRRVAGRIEKLNSELEDRTTWERFKDLLKDLVAR